jgi:hypothetical protein
MAVRGNQAVLIGTSDNKTILIQVDRNGALNWGRKYGKADNGIPPACFLKINDAYDILLSDFSRNFHLLRTDPIGRIDCDSIECSHDTGNDTGIQWKCK